MQGGASSKMCLVAMKYVFRPKWAILDHFKGRWCKVVQGGARWCKVVQDGARWCNLVGAKMWSFATNGEIDVFLTETFCFLHVDF